MKKVFALALVAALGLATTQFASAQDSTSAKKECCKKGGSCCKKGAAAKTSVKKAVKVKKTA